MRKWLTAFILIAAMLGGAVGVGAHENEASCALTNLPDCCKRAHSNRNTPEVSMARLCCNLNCSEPGSTGSNSSSSFSRQPGSAPSSAVMPTAALFNNVVLLGRYARWPHRQDSSPKYIQHLALL